MVQLCFLTQSASRMASNKMNLKRSASPIGGGDRRDLSGSFVPGDYDVICGKGKGCFNHQGNKNFRKIVGLFLESYSEASSKLEKSAIVSAIIQTVRSQSGEGGFVKKDSSTGLWVEVGDHLAREKVGQTIRDALHFQYRSSTKAKKKRRQVEQAKASANMNQISMSHFEISSKINGLKDKVTETSTDRQLSDLFTQANLEILNELNRLNQLRPVEAAPETTMANLGQASLPMPSLPRPPSPRPQSFSNHNAIINDMSFSLPMNYQPHMQNPSLQNLLSPATLLQDSRNFLQENGVYDDDDDSVSVYPL